MKSKKNAATDVTRRAINADLVGVPGGAKRLTTPALMIDLPKLRANLAAMNKRAAAGGMRLRPHGKSHKSSTIAREQLAQGAIGLCCATAHEAFAFARGGIGGLLVTAPIVQPRHRAALADLHRGGADIAVVVDRRDGVAAWEAALGKPKRKLPVLVDIDLGMGRTGARSAQDIVAIAGALAASPALSFAGVQAYSGQVQHIESYAARRTEYLAQLRILAEAIGALSAAGLPPEIVSGGGTGSFAIDVEHGLYTESQAGSYMFMDVEYNAVEFFPGRKNPYATALFMRTSVVNTNVPGQVTINAGFKCFATDGPVPQPYGKAHAGARYEFFGDEYGKLVLPAGKRAPRLGDAIDLVTPHCDPTVNLHDFYHVVEGDTLVALWPIDGRGVS